MRQTRYIAMGPSDWSESEGWPVTQWIFSLKHTSTTLLLETGYAHLWEINTRTIGSSSDFGWLTLPCGDNHESPHHPITAAFFDQWFRQLPMVHGREVPHRKSHHRHGAESPEEGGVTNDLWGEGVDMAPRWWGFSRFFGAWRMQMPNVLVSDSRYEVNGGPKLWTVELRGTRIAPNWQVYGARHGRHLWDFWPGGWFHTACTHTQTSIRPSVRPSVHAWCTQCAHAPVHPCTRTHTQIYIYTHTYIT